jgi:transcriptional regulator with XRE-family HTH domain
MHLRQARENKRMTQVELAEATDLSQTQVSHIELGKCSPRPTTMRRIEKALGARVNWLTTKGVCSYQEGELSTWEHVDQTFRKALREINGLQNAERREFIKLARQYMKDFEDGIENKTVG